MTQCVKAQESILLVLLFLPASILFSCSFERTLHLKVSSSLEAARLLKASMEMTRMGDAFLPSSCLGSS